MKPYRASGTIPSDSLLPLVLVTALAALAGGAVLHFVGDYFRLVILWPAAMGGAAGIAAMRIIRARKIRAPGVALAVGLAGGLLAWSTDFGLGFYRVRAAVDDAITVIGIDFEIPEDAVAARREATLDAFLRAMGEGDGATDVAAVATLLGEPVILEDGTQVAPLPEATRMDALGGYVRWQAAQGMTIDRHGRETEVKGGAMMAFWLLELLVAALVGGFVAGKEAREPFCERCGLWYGPEAPLLTVGHPKSADVLAQALERGDASLALTAVPAEGLPKKKLLAVSSRRCPKCTTADRQVKLARLVVSGKKVQRKDLKTGMVPAAHADGVLGALAEAVKKQPAA